MLGEYIGAGSSVTKILLHLNTNSDDESGNSKDGVDTSITYTDGKIGNGSACFSGSSKITCNASNLNFGGTDSFTQSLWVNLSSMPASGKICMLTIIASDAGTRTYDKGIAITDSGIADCYVYNSGEYHCSSSTGVIVKDTWYNIVFTYDGTNMKIYVNSILKKTTAAPGSTAINSPYLVLSNLANYSWLGKTVVRVNGYIDEVIIESGAWTHTEVQKYYTQALGRFNN